MALKQHPVPQHIASYEFRLVGDMTLKQFGWLAGGIVIALLFYALPLPFYFKWPAVITFGILGIAFAFFPLEERPLNEWVAAFFKSVFSPTYFIWHKKSLKPAFFTFKASQPSKPTPVSASVNPLQDKRPLGEYLQTLPSPPPGDFEQQEAARLEQLYRLFHHADTPPPTPAPTPNPPSAPIAPQPSPLVAQAVPSQPPSIQVPTGWNIPNPGFAPAADNLEPAVAATINRKLPFPTPPTQPNLIVGMVTSPQQDIIVGAIIEIRNRQGAPVRALKTNQLGQFMIATPLENGPYEIETEKEGFTFDIIKLEVKGEIIPPIEIRAKTETN